MDYREIKRVAIVVETTHGEFMTVYSESPGTHITLKRDIESPPGWYGDEVLAREVEQFMTVEVSRMRRWIVSMKDPFRQFDYLDLIRRAIQDVRPD